MSIEKGKKFSATADAAAEFVVALAKGCVCARR